MIFLITFPYEKYGVEGVERIRRRRSFTIIDYIGGGSKCMPMKHSRWIEIQNDPIRLINEVNSYVKPISRK